MCGLAEHCWTVRDWVRGLNHGGRVGNGKDGADVGGSAEGKAKDSQQVEEAEDSSLKPGSFKKCYVLKRKRKDKNSCCFVGVNVMKLILDIFSLSFQ